MNRSLTARLVAGAAVALATLGAATAAQANPNIFLSIGVPGRAAYYEPAPVYVQRERVFVEPRPVYMQPPAYGYGRPSWSSHASAFERQREWRRAEWQRREWERRHQWEHRHGRDRDDDRSHGHRD
jgi:hypothetical protein